MMDNFSRPIAEIRNDYIDDENVGYVDVFFTDDDMEEGMNVCRVCLDTGKVFYRDDFWRLNRKVREAVQELQDKTTLIKEKTHQ